MTQPSNFLTIVRLEGSSDHRDTVQQLADLTQAYISHNVNASISLALASLRTDDLTCLLEHCKES